VSAESAASNVSARQLLQHLEDLFPSGRSWPGRWVGEAGAAPAGGDDGQEDVGAAPAQLGGGGLGLLGEVAEAQPRDVDRVGDLGRERVEQAHDADPPALALDHRGARRS
jgi:hypothetical protein